MVVIRVNLDDCIGCGVCAELCPEAFVLDEDEGEARIISQKACAEVKEAVDSCPVSAISCEDKQ